MPKTKVHKRGGSLFNIDGRTLEGGGQLLRLAVGLSALTRQPLTITNIRGNRHGSRGLKAQHLACVTWLARACNAETQGAQIMSQSLVFKPGTATTCPPTYTLRDDLGHHPMYESRIDIGSPGSVALALQAVLPFILFSPLGPKRDDEQRSYMKLTITGGTNVSNSPSYDYISQVLLPTLSLIGLPKIESTRDARGWSSGTTCIGSVTFTIPTLAADEQLPAIVLRPPDDTQESDIEPSGIVATIIAPESARDQSCADIFALIHSTFPLLREQDVDLRFEDSQHDKRFYLLLVATVIHDKQEYKLGSDELFQGKFPKESKGIAKEMARRVTTRLAEDIKSGACVDRHMIDQLIIFQALAAGKSDVWRGVNGDGQALGQSLHAETAEWITSELVGARLRNGKGKGFGLIARGVRDDDTDVRDETVEELNTCAGALQAISL